MPDNPLAVQLYTVRNELAGGRRAVLSQIAGFGYGAAEPYDVVTDPDALRADLDAAGLVACSVHGRMDTPEAAAAVASGTRTVGADTIFVPYQPPERFETSESVAELAGELRELTRFAVGEGLRLGYHNHDFELATLLDGRPALEVLADLAGDDLVLELDIYWAAVGGQDVAALLRRLGERVVALHVKDGPATSRDDAMTAVGAGRVPIADILAAAPWVSWHIVELDRCDTDMLTAVADSRSWLVSAGLAA